MFARRTGQPLLAELYRVSDTVTEEASVVHVVPVPVP